MKSTLSDVISEDHIEDNSNEKPLKPAKHDGTCRQHRDGEVTKKGVIRVDCWKIEEDHQ
jgi:hypothetical protein